MAKYKINQFKTIRVNASQELVIGRVWVDGKEYATIRERVPGRKDSKGVNFPADLLTQVIEGATELNEFLHGGDRTPSPDQQSLF